MRWKTSIRPPMAMKPGCDPYRERNVSMHLFSSNAGFLYLEIENSPIGFVTYNLWLTGFDKDGGWGQSSLSCPKNKYVPLEGNQSDLLHATWALISLISCEADS